MNQVDLILEFKVSGEFSIEELIALFLEKIDVDEKTIKSKNYLKNEKEAKFELKDYSIK